jgi:hypothetical protein
VSTREPENEWGDRQTQSPGALGGGTARPTYRVNSVVDTDRFQFCNFRRHMTTTPVMFAPSCNVCVCGGACACAIAIGQIPPSAACVHCDTPSVTWHTCTHQAVDEQRQVLRADAGLAAQYTPHKDEFTRASWVVVVVMMAVVQGEGSRDFTHLENLGDESRRDGDLVLHLPDGERQVSADALCKTMRESRVFAFTLCMPICAREGRRVGKSAPHVMLCCLQKPFRSSLGSPGSSEMIVFSFSLLRSASRGPVSTRARARLRGR